MCLRQREGEQMESFSRDQSWWNDACTVITSVNSYKQVVHVLFEDGIVNQGRLLVLEMFTKDLCERYPHMATEVWNHYKNTCTALNPHLSLRHQ